MYAIETDKLRNLILIRFGGMMSIEETDAYFAELRARFARDRFQPGYRMLVDIEECTIQSQAMIAALREHIASFPKASRIATVTNSPLARMQVRRVMTQSYACVFASRDEALDWLTDERAAA